MLIEVFGPGCAKCQTLEKHARHAAEQSGGDHQVVKISDYATMAISDDLQAQTEQCLKNIEAEWDRRVALGVVMAAAGYPEAPRKGDTIHGLPPAGDDYHVFHAGTALSGRDVVTAGGRVLCVTALGSNVRAAQMRAYDIAEQIEFDGMQMRRDIGHRAIRR